MAPGRRRGASKATTKGQLKLGDLVLAKVKGFPPWPAKISKPEDWKRPPDSKKCFVKFFGTNEIAFIAPGDVQAFTADVKTRLLSRDQSKASCFAEAVKEICEAFDELNKHNSSCLQDDTDGSDFGSGAPIVDELEENEVEVDLKGGMVTVESNQAMDDDIGDGVQNYFEVEGGVNGYDVKPKLEFHPNHGPSPAFSSEKGEKMSDVTDDILVNSGLKSPQLKEELSVINSDDIQTPGNRENLKSDSKIGGEKAKDLLKGMQNSKVKNEPPREIKEVHYVRKRRLPPREGKSGLETNDNMHGAKKMKSEELEDAQGSLNKGKKMVSGSSNVADVKEVKTPEFQKYSSRAKLENALNVRSASGTSNISCDKELQSQSSTGQLQQTSVAIVNNKMDKSLPEKKDAPHNNTVKVHANQLHKKRRAVRLFDDDDDEEPKTPVHGGYALNVITPSEILNDTKKTAALSMRSNHAEWNIKKKSSSQDSHSKESSRLLIKTPQTPQLKNKKNESEKSMTAFVSHSLEKLESEKLTLKTPKRYPAVVMDIKQVVEEGNIPKFPANFPRVNTQKKTHALSSKGTGERSLKFPQAQDTTQSKRLASSVERSKSTPKSSNRGNEYAVSNEMSVEDSHFSGRMETVREDKSRLVIVSKTSDSSTSMKHLIAAAQAKRRQTDSQNSSLGVFDSAFFPITDMQEESPSPSSVQHFLPSTNNMAYSNVPGSYQLSDIPSLPINDRPSTSPNQSDIREWKEGRTSSGDRAVGDALSGGTEASVARDAFEGMIETLSRTKESIGRATRHAIDCAKYGIANEVVELLIRKLEIETIVQRKVDLFFLVDSITQCSHSQRGIAGASYIPIIQAALPRFLGAAAPPGASARENRRQCHKVLRLWLERKILPETILRRHIEELGVSNDDSTVSFSLRRPARAERSVDDPIREMEGMLVDEYGSNATFQLPGFLPSRVFEVEDEDEDFESNPLKETANTSPTHDINDFEACAVTPSDRHHFILDDVDGELEMEDVSGQLKGANPLVKNISLAMSLPEECLEKSMEHLELPPLPECSPPLPVDSPPPLPPLPSSPPPPLSPSSPHPPPPSLLSQPSLPLLPPGPPPLLISQLEPTQRSFPPRQIPPPQSSLQSSQQLAYQVPPPQSSLQSSQQLAYQVPVPLEYCRTSSGNQHVQMGNLSHGGQVDGPVKSDTFQQQSGCFVPTGTCTSQEPCGISSSRQLEYRLNDMYLNTQLSHPNQPFQPVNPPFVQGPQQPTPPLNLSSHFSFSNTAAHHQPPHPCGPYSLPSLPDSRRQFSGDGQWRMPVGEFKAENQSLWINGGRPPSYTGPPFGQEGYFGPAYVRPPSNSISYQQPIPNNLPSGVPISGHSVPQMLPSRPNISTLNAWRQA